MSIQEKILKALGVTKEEYDKEMGCVSEYIDQRGKNVGYSFGEWGEDPRGQYASSQAQPVYYRRTIGSIPKGGTPTFEQLEDPDSPFNLSLEALSNMWGARFGYRWVKDEDTADAVEENEEMWGFVVSRLLKTGLLVSQQYLQPDKLGVGQAWKLIEKDHGNR